MTKTALDFLLDELELPATAYKTAESRYEDLEEFLSTSSSIKQYEPQIFVQGSFRLGTAIKPLVSTEPYDLDLRNNGGMSFKDLSDVQVVLEGTYHLCAYHISKGNIDCDYELRIEIPACFPKEIPVVRETNNKIPRDDKHHINRSNITRQDSLCLGSRITLLQKLFKCPTVSGFVEQCVVPFLYASHSNDYVFGELAHGYKGILADYKNIFRVSENKQVLIF